MTYNTDMDGNSYNIWSNSVFVDGIELFNSW